mmetsp:Transcript_20024/g.14511  ORF Transcript_20024/g.14511 Transcript_20024/m.14511 type:complete len:160 (+) Transcript_20024:34-513(+)|eukprot:CAMPEP_0116893016 /NCGR_PEP_ID=MMETSP0467-20121206/3101_1 /TAXON_ID=283647 /ORGANISM="Mesodinium pulex, Strain SPMC105" /LENGTH=159 /DNA_ID=CAMNT_0004562447 /DNA_START=48 /DNA_END=527 /DNA_ORIENTATION=-
MADIDDYDFSATDAGASTVYNMEGGQIRKGGYIVIKGHPCKVVDVSTSKTGKHGHAKCNFVAVDIFTNKKYEDIVQSTHNTSVPNVSRKDYSLVDISEDDFCSLFDVETSETREDIKLPDVPEGFAREIRAAFDEGKALIVSVLSAMDHEQIIAFKEEA